MELPHSPDELERMLEEKLHRWRRAADEAERARTSRRLEVVSTFREQIAAESARLAQLGLDAEAREANALAARLEAEWASLSARLAPVPDAAAAVTPPSETAPVCAASATTPQEAATPQPRAGAQAELAAAPRAGEAPATPRAGETCSAEAIMPDAPAPQADAKAAPPADSAKLREEAARDVEALYEAFRMLDQAVNTFDWDELKLRIEILACKGNLLQKRFPFLRKPELSTAADRLHHIFGGLTRICKKVLNPENIYVDSLKRGASADWEHQLKKYEGQLNDLLQERADSQRRKVEDEENRRRRAQVEAENQRHLQALRTEILAQVNLPALEQDSYWSEDLRDLVEDYLKYCPKDKDIDGDVIGALRPFSIHFEAGSRFRRLRKKLNPKAGDSAALEKAIDEVAVSQNPTLNKTREFEQWRGYYAKCSAALIGGSERETARERLKDFFQFATLDWIENERTETADTRSVEQRIKNGRYNLVFYLARFSSHSLQACVKDACRESGVPFVLVERGYGIGACCRALERMGDMVLKLGGPQ